MWFPLFGLLIGAWGAVWFNAFAVVLPASVAAGISTLATVWFTGKVKVSETAIALLLIVHYDSMACIRC